MELAAYSGLARQMEVMNLVNDIIIHYAALL